jgi:hypothetical protein
VEGLAECLLQPLDLFVRVLLTSTGAAHRALRREHCGPRIAPRPADSPEGKMDQVQIGSPSEAVPVPPTLIVQVLPVTASCVALASQPAAEALPIVMFTPVDGVKLMSARDVL